MSTDGHRKIPILVTAAILLCASPTLAQPSASPAPPATASELVRRDLVGMPGKEIVMSQIVYPPGGSGTPHRHHAQVFVYVLEGKVLMQVKGGPLQTLGPGEMFYENPSDIHVVSANASKTEPAKYIAILIKDKGKPTSEPVASDQAR